MFEVKALSCDGFLQVDVAGEFDYSVTPRVDELCESMAGVARLPVHLDLTRCSYIDSSAVNAIVRFSKDGLKGFQVLISSVGIVHRLFEICGLLAQPYVVVVAASA